MFRRSVRMKIAVDAMKKAEYMEQHIGEEFDGIVSSVTPFGLFIELENTVEGLVHVSELADDRYEYNEELMCLVGFRTKKIYRLGDEVQVEVLKADKKEAIVDFKIVRSYTHERLEEERLNGKSGDKE